MGEEGASDGSAVLPDMEENNEAPFTGLINGQQGRIVHREALKVRVEFKTPYAVLFETIELFLPVFIAGVQRTEGNGPVSLVLVNFDGVIVGGENLGGSRSCAENGKVADSGPDFLFLEIREQSGSEAVHAIRFFEGSDGL